MFTFIYYRFVAGLISKLNLKSKVAGSRILLRQHKQSMLGFLISLPISVSCVDTNKIIH